MAVVELSKSVAKQIEALRAPFKAYAAQYGKLAATRAELAPRFMQAFGAWMQEVGGSFVEFCRLVDPGIPQDRTAYRTHQSYQAADYLRRLVSRRDTGERRTQPVRSNLTATARLLATILPLVRDTDALWEGIAVELGLKPRQITRLKEVTSAVKPLIDLSGIRPLRDVKIIHVEQPAAAPAASEEGEHRTPRQRAA